MRSAALLLLFAACKPATSVSETATATSSATPTPSATAAPSATSTSTSTPTATGSATVIASATATGSGSPLPNPPPQAGEGAEEPALVDGEGKLLPQSEDQPAGDSPLFRRHLEQLVAAIAADDPERARAAFFPVKAYEAVKNIKQPAKDWEQRLFRAFAKAVHEYHKKLGERAAGTKLARLELPKKITWMKPGSEGNGIGYWRAVRSHLFVTDGAGRERDLELTSLISWRGEWYVVHLHGFK